MLKALILGFPDPVSMGLASDWSQDLWYMVSQARRGQCRFRAGPWLGKDGTGCFDAWNLRVTGN